MSHTQHSHSVNVSSLNKETLNMEDNVSTLLINVQSLRGKFLELVNILASITIQFTFLIFTEVWLNDNLNVKLNIDGYKRVSCLRNENGGGIIVYYRNFITANINSAFTGIFESHESLLLDCSIPGCGNLYLWSIYRPPSRCGDSFNSYMENNLKFLKGKRCIIVGDFNFNILHATMNRQTRDYIDVFSSHGYTQCIDAPTYYSPTLNKPTSCLDHVWKNFSTACNTYILTPPISDHMGVIAIFNINIKHVVNSVSSFRDYSAHNKSRFCECLPLESSFFQFVSNDVNRETNRLFAWIKNLINKYFPIRKKSLCTKRANTPWMTAKIVKCVRKKHQWFKLLQGGLITKNSYKQYCSMLKNLLATAERVYYREKFERVGGNSKNRWKILNNLLGKSPAPEVNSLEVNGSLTQNCQAIANAFGNYFITVPQQVASRIPQSHIDGLSHIPNNLNSIFFSPTNVFEVTEIVKNIKGSNSEEDIAIKVLKLGMQTFSTFICILFNECLNSGTYPSVLKEARVVPVFKSGSKVQVSNYRPISILLNINKIFEKIIYKRLYSYVENHNILTPKQFGFRSGSGTETAILQLINNILPAFTDGKLVICTFLDFSKAFDTVNHRILLSKLEKYGVRGLALNLIKSYLDGRKQSVTIGGISSFMGDVFIGTPQGSCISPLLFSLYTNDLIAFLNNPDSVLYADDTTIVSVAKEVNDIENITNDYLSRVIGWSNFNKLSLNASKSKCVLFTNRHIAVPPIIHINQTNVELVHSYNYLGVDIDGKLKFQVYIDKLTSKISKVCGISYRIGSLLDLTTAKCFYYAFFYSTVTYCLTAWGGCLLHSERGRKLCKLQDRIVKNLFGPFEDVPTDQLYSTFDLLKLVDIYRFRVALMMYKMLFFNYTPNILNLLDIHSANHDHFTRNRNDLLPPFPRVEAIRQSYKFNFIQIWNTIPNNIKNSRTVSSFKHKLINYYITA